MHRCRVAQVLDPQVSRELLRRSAVGARHQPVYLLGGETGILNRTYDRLQLQGEQARSWLEATRVRCLPNTDDTGLILQRKRVLVDVSVLDVSYCRAPPPPSVLR